MDALEIRNRSITEYKPHQHTPTKEQQRHVNCVRSKSVFVGFGTGAIEHSISELTKETEVAEVACAARKWVGQVVGPVTPSTKEKNGA